jgi:hypothetical protein
MAAAKAKAKAPPPKVPGVPEWLLQYLFDRLKDGRATAKEQQEAYKILAHKCFRRPGPVPNLVSIKSARVLSARDQAHAGPRRKAGPGRLPRECAGVSGRAETLDEWRSIGTLARPQ